MVHIVLIVQEGQEIKGSVSVQTVSVSALQFCDGLLFLHIKGLLTCLLSLEERNHNQH